MAPLEREVHGAVAPVAHKRTTRRTSGVAESAAAAAAVQLDVTLAPKARGAKGRGGGKAAPAEAAAAASGTTTPAAGEPHPPGLTPYEVQRLELIARNRARMAALELPQLAADFAAAVAPPKPARAGATQKGVGSKRKAAAPALPPRASGRLRGVAPDAATAGGIAHEGRDGRIVLAAAPAGVGGGGSEAGGCGGAAKAEPAPRFVEGPVPFASSNATPADDAAFLELLKREAGGAAGANTTGAKARGGGGAGKRGAGAAANGAAAGGNGGCADVASLRLDPEDVAKMTKAGTTAVAWHPLSGSRPVVAAADKGGQVALWDVDYGRDSGGGGGGEEKEGREGAGALRRGGGGAVAGEGGEGEGGGEEGAGGHDGILVFGAHKEYVSALRWAGCGGGARLLSASYDGSARLLDVTKGEFLLLPALPLPAAGAEWSAAEADAAGDVVYLATPEGCAAIMDTRAAAAVATGLELHDRKINTLALLGSSCGGGGEGGAGGGPGHLLASSCSDGSVKVWDARRLAGGGKRPAPLSALRHAKSSQGAAWAPDGGGRLLSVSFDDTLKVWGSPGDKASPEPGKGMAQLLSVRHNNNTGRWVIPFRPAWWGSDVLLVGDMRRGVAAFDASTGAPRALLSSDALTAIPSRLAAWRPGAGGAEGGRAMLAAATSSGRVHIFR